MIINIQIDENGSVRASSHAPAAGSDIPLAGAMAGIQDGGAPRLTGNNSQLSVTGGDVTDIGGPPQWLRDAVMGEGVQDGGAGPAA
jgi:hypothetical protein